MTDAVAAPTPEAPLDAEAPAWRPTAAAVLAAAGAAWMVGGIFRGQEARLIALLGVAIGGALVYAGQRLRQSGLAAVAPLVGLVVGAALVAPDARAGTTSLPALVVDAVRTGGILQPPIDLQPGWKLILVLIFATVTAGAASLAVALARPRLAAALPLPLLVLAALIEPSDTEVTGAAVGLVLVVAALSVSFSAAGGGGGGGGGESRTGAGFELRRIARSGAVATGALAVLLAVNQAGILFPQPNKDRTLPPTRPQIPPPAADVPLFLVGGSNGVPPLRLGVIDVYDATQGAWLLPPYDTARLQRTNGGAGDLHPAATHRSPALTVTVTVEQATGHLLPVPANTIHISGLDSPSDYDPRSETVRLASRPVYTGLQYQVTAALAPAGADLGQTGPPPASLADMLAMPAPPAEVRALLQGAPQSRFDRLQYVRQALYSKVVAAGGGAPADVSPAKVVAMLGGAQANPYEITAAEAMLARWAGIPARIAYGYYGGTRQPDGRYEIRPAQGSTWLEAYFNGYGWVPVLGVPPHARASLSEAKKRQNPGIQPVDELGLVLFLPVRQHTLTPLYVVLRYFLVRLLPVVGAVALLLLVYPAAVKVLRRRRRRRWAGRAGPLPRIAVAYAEVRDAAIDIAVGSPLQTPLEFLLSVEDDEEHAELAWLVTRVLWGDMREAADPMTVAMTERMAASVRRRLLGAQPLTTRLVAACVRTSLRDPYSLEVPNLWWTGRATRALRSLLGSVRLRRPRRRPWAVAAATSALSLLLLGGCGSGPAAARPSNALPARLAPPTLDTVVVQEEPDAEKEYRRALGDPDVMVGQGRVYTLRQTDVVQASLQVAPLRDGYSGADPDVVQGIEGQLGDFHALGQGIDVAIQPDERIYVWFPAHGAALAVLTVRQAFDRNAADAMARLLEQYEVGGATPTFTAPPPPTPEPPATPIAGVPA